MREFILTLVATLALIVMVQWILDPEFRVDGYLGIIIFLLVKQEVKQEFKDLNFKD